MSGMIGLIRLFHLHLFRTLLCPPSPFAVEPDSRTSAPWEVRTRSSSATATGPRGRWRSVCVWTARGCSSIFLTDTLLFLSYSFNLRFACKWCNFISFFFFFTITTAIKLLSTAIYRKWKTGQNCVIQYFSVARTAKVSSWIRRSGPYTCQVNIGLIFCNIHKHFVSFPSLWVCVSVGVAHSAQCVHECEAVHTDVKYVFVSRWWNSWLIITMKCSLFQRKWRPTASTSKAPPTETSCSTDLQRNVLTVSRWVHLGEFCPFL